MMDAAAGEATHCVPLGELRDFRVAGDDADPRGWAVIAGDGARVGVVAELIVDPDALKVRYLECRLEADRRAVFVPIGFARLDEERCEVLVDTLEADGFARLAVAMALPRTRAEEQMLHAIFKGDAAPDGATTRDAAPGGVTTRDAAPGDVTTRDAAPGGVTDDAAPGGTVPDS